MQVLKQNTSNQYVAIYLVDSTDGYSPETGVTAPTIYAAKNGGAEAALNDGTWAEIDATNCPGAYWLRLDATDTNTVGPILIDVIKTGTSRHFVTVCQVSASLLDDLKTVVDAILADTGTDGVKIATAEKAAIVDATWDEATAGHVTAGSTGKALTDSGAAANPWETAPSTYGTYSDTFGHVIARAVGGAGAGLVTLTIQDADDNPVENVRVDIYSAATPSAAAYYTHGVSNVSGQVSFYLPDGTWYAFRRRRGFSWQDPVTVVVA